MPELWTQLTAKANLTLSEEQVALLNRYLDLLFEANQVMNLTRITDRAEAEVQHIGDSLTLLPFLPQGCRTLADVGSGGGVPGIPLAIVLPNTQVTLIESTLKKAAFLSRTVHELKLPNVKVSPERAEHYTRLRPPVKFEVVVARALAATDQLVRWSLPLVKPGGKLLAMKGPKLTEELPLARGSVKRLHGQDLQIHPVDLPGTTGRVILEIRSTR